MTILTVCVIQDMKLLQQGQAVRKLMNENGGYPDPCENGGTCTDLVNAYSCACVPGFTDANCTTNIDECDPDSCENGGTCTDMVNAYSCLCILDFSGDTCDSKLGW